MHLLGVVGPGAATVAERLAPRLDGRVATIHDRHPDAPARPDGVDTVHHLHDGAWHATGDDRSLGDALDAVAPDHDFALLSGFSRRRVPTVVVGDADVAGEVVLRVDDADELDVDHLAELANEGEPHVTLESLVRRVKDAPGAERSGAIATFTGRVRAKDSDDDSRTTHLEFEKYEGVAEARMADICDELAAREGVQNVVMHHRTGLLRDGEDIVFVVVLAGHREEAFRTVEDGINRLKDEVPIFKKESTVDEEFWVHDRE